MSKTKITEAAVTRAARGAIKAGVDIGTIELLPDGRILVRAKGEIVPKEDDPEELRRLL